MMLLTFATLIAFTSGVRVQTVEVAGLQFVATGNKSKIRSFGNALPARGHEELGLAPVHELPGSGEKCCCAGEIGNMIAFDVQYALAVGHTGLRLGSRCPWIGRWETDPCACTIREGAAWYENAVHAARYWNMNMGPSTWDAPTTCTAEESVGSHSPKNMGSDEKVKECNRLCGKNRTSISQACADGMEYSKSRWGLDDECIKKLSELPPEVQKRVMSSFSSKQEKGSDNLKREFSLFLQRADMISKFKLDDECELGLAELPQASQKYFMTKLAIDRSADEMDKETFLTYLTAFNTVQKRIDGFKDAFKLDEDCVQALKVKSFVMQKYIIENFEVELKKDVKEEDFKLAFNRFVSIVDNFVKSRQVTNPDAVTNPREDLEIKAPSDEEKKKGLRDTCSQECSAFGSQSIERTKCVDKCCWTTCGLFAEDKGFADKKGTCVTTCEGKEVRQRKPIPKLVQETPIWTQGGLTPSQIAEQQRANGGVSQD